jgi:hypothetical protein
MKVSVVVAGLVWPALAFGQQLYTNADLSKIDVPGAYTNEDLRRLPPLVMQKQPAATLPPFVSTAPSQDLIARYEDAYGSLREGRDSLAFELDFELKRVDFSESAFSGDTRSIGPRLGYRSRVAPLILELEKRIAILDHQMETLLQDARRAGVEIDAR